MGLNFCPTYETHHENIPAGDHRVNIAGIFFIPLSMRRDSRHSIYQIWWWEDHKSFSFKAEVCEVLHIKCFFKNPVPLYLLMHSMYKGLFLVNGLKTPQTQLNRKKSYLRGNKVEANMRAPSLSFGKGLMWNSCSLCIYFPNRKLQTVQMASFCFFFSYWYYHHSYVWDLRCLTLLCVFFFQLCESCRSLSCLTFPLPACRARNFT